MRQVDALEILLGLQGLTSGEVYLDGGPLSSLGRKHIASCVQPIFQDPFASLNARQTVGEIVGLPLRVHREMSRADRRQSVKAMLDRVGIAEQMVDVFPHELSGGQRQRVAIARALILRPPIVICDEPTSALDVSVQAQILNLLMELQRELGTSYLLITHNLGIVEHIASRVAVMYAGRIVEVGETERCSARLSIPIRKRFSLPFREFGQQSERSSISERHSRIQSTFRKAARFTRVAGLRARSAARRHRPLQRPQRARSNAT